jgi:hypothetical protein
VLDLMLDQNEINDVEYTRAATRSSRRCARRSAAGQRLRHERSLSRAGPHPLQGSLSDHQGRLTISITRDDALQDVLATPSA